MHEHKSTNFTCIKTKEINSIRTTLCIYDPETDLISAEVVKNGVFEERGVQSFLNILSKHEHLSMIDIGANIGTYTMYTAALGRLTLAVECFGPSTDRIRRAVQLENLYDRVILISNAIYNSSNKYLRLSKSNDNIGSQHLNGNFSIKDSSVDYAHIVRTIRFDDLLPILEKFQIRSAIMKIDIEASENFMCQTGSEVFNRINIPYVMMEWMNIRLFKDRADLVVHFFQRRKYIPMNEYCELVLSKDYYEDWPAVVIWIKANYIHFCTK
jgi:FkbM family methyltransferase